MVCSTAPTIRIGGSDIPTEAVKDRFLQLDSEHIMIRKMGEHPEQYVRQPGRDFTRPRTLTFETVISLLMTMSENSIGKIRIRRFQNSEKTPPASAFVQQRQKLLPAALETLFHRFTALLRPEKTFCGCRLPAVDGSSLKSAAYPENPDRFPLAALKVLYARRWGIETSFRSLKYAVGLIHLHAKKPDLVLQEVFASFLIFNFTQAAAWAVDASQGTAKYKHG